MTSKIIVTGCAGFIGSALVNKLLLLGKDVIGIDNVNSYYDIELKKSRLRNLEETKKKVKGKFEFYKIDLEDKQFLDNIVFGKNLISTVINLAAQAGVRYSLENPQAYVSSNLVGFFNILDLSKKYKVKNFLYASSSSVYGGNQILPFSEKQSVDHPVSFYAATKKSNEILAHSYSHLYKLPCTGLRFFTVYGPWGRPDMAPMIFAKKIIQGRPIKIFNNGLMKRDFTYIDDIVESLVRCCDKPANEDKDFFRSLPKPCTSFAPHRIFNIGNSKTVELMYFIELMERFLNKKAIKDFQPLQQGDIISTESDSQLLEKWINFKPQVSIEKGVEKFLNWFRSYYVNL